MTQTGIATQTPANNDPFEVEDLSMDFLLAASTAVQAVPTSTVSGEYRRRALTLTGHRDHKVAATARKVLNVVDVRLSDLQLLDDAVAADRRAAQDEDARAEAGLLWAAIQAAGLR